jgi:putative membrane protein (TIGR04086 family)
MSIRPLVSKPSLVALCLGAIAMVLVYGSGSLLLSLARPRWSYEENESRVISLVFPVATYLVSGYVVGYFAKRAPLMHGALLGLLVMGLFACGTLALGGDISPVRFAQLTVGAMVICCLGAILGDSIAQR